MKRLFFLLLILSLPILQTAEVAPASFPSLGLTPVAPPRSDDSHEARELELVNHLGGPAEAVFVAEEYLYTNFGPELAVLDITRPTQPRRVGYTIVPDLIRQIRIAGAYAYVITGQGSLQIVDISDPTAPEKVGSYDPPDNFTRVALGDGYAYVATRPHWQVNEMVGGGLRILDISAPATPREVGFLALGEAVDDVAVFEDAAGSGTVYAYISSGGTLRIVDVSDPTAPQELLSNALSTYNKVIIQDRYAYLLGGKSLHVMDLTTPSRPLQVGMYQTWGQFEDMVLAGDHIYLVNQEGGSRHSSVEVVDISDPAQPIRQGSYSLKGQLHTAALSGEYLYVAAGDLGVRVVDVSAPDQPAEVAFFNPSTLVAEMSLLDNYAYAPVAGGSLTILDLADPANPLELGRYPLPASDQNSGNIQVTAILSDSSRPEYRYLAQCRSPGGMFNECYLQGLDLSTPMMPVKLGTYRTAGSAAAEPAIANLPAGSKSFYAFLPAGLMGLRVVDLSDPLAPVEVGAYFAPPATIGTVKEELTFQDYTVRITRDEATYQETLDIFKDNRLLYTQQEQLFYFYDSDREIKDISGNGLPDLVVRGFTGGAHCCESTYIFELAEPLRLVAVMDTAHSPGYFNDLDGDQIPEFERHDWTFAYWATAFAGSPAPQVILSYQDGRYRPAIELMRQPERDPATLEDRAQEIRTDPQMWPEADPPPQLWGEMLDLIYSGHASLAWPFFEQAWPPDVPGKETFLASFLAQLSSSPYWPAIQKLNQGQWPPSFDPETSATLLPLPTATELPASIEFPAVTAAEAAGDQPEEVQGAVETVFVQDSYAYAGMGSTLVVLDVTTPAQPQPVGYVALPGQVKDIYVVGEYAYLAKEVEWVEGRPVGGLWIVDVSDPETPTVTGSYETVGGVDDLTLFDGYLYGVGQPELYDELDSVSGGLWVFDLSDPTAPEEINFYKLPWGASRVSLMGMVENYIYLSANEAGMFILRFN